MKFLFALGFACLFAFTAGISEEQKETMRKIHEQCLEDSKVDVALVQKMRQGDFSSDDEKLQRYAFCISLKNDLITSEGELKKDVILLKISNDQDKKKNVSSVCMQELGKNPLESVWKITKCYYGKPMPTAIPDHP